MSVKYIVASYASLSYDVNWVFNFFFATNTQRKPFIKVLPARTSVYILFSSL